MQLSNLSGLIKSLIFSPIPTLLFLQSKSWYFSDLNPDISLIWILIFFQSKSWSTKNPTPANPARPRKRPNFVFSERLTLLQQSQQNQNATSATMLKSENFVARRLIVILSKRVLHNSVVSINKDLRKVVVFYQSVSEVSKVCKRSESWGKMPHLRKCNYIHDRHTNIILFENGNTEKVTEKWWDLKNM